MARGRSRRAGGEPGARWAIPPFGDRRRSQDPGRARWITPAPLAVALASLVSAVPAGAAGELTLEACRRSARQEHPQLAAARAQVAAATARGAIAFAGFLPGVAGDLSFLALRGAASAGGGTTGGTSGGVSAGGARSTDFVGPADLELFGAGLTVRQTIWDFGRTLNAHQAARAGSRAAEAERINAETRLDVEAEAAFRTTVASDELVAAMTEARSRAAAQLERARARAEVGLRPRYDVARAEVELANAELLLVAAQNARGIARAQLANACGRAALPEGETLAAAPPREPPPPRALEEAVIEALGRRPELVAALERLEAAEQASEAARSLYLPSVGAVGTVAYRGLAVDELSPGWSALVQLSVPILAGGGDAARVREAEANAEAARAAVELARRGIRVEVESARLSVDEARARLSSTTQLERASEEGLRLAEGRYETGLADALEVADAQAILASAKASRVRAGLDLSVAIARLERAEGKGVQR